MYTGDAVSVMFSTRKDDFTDGMKPSNVPCEPIECMGGGGGIGVPAHAIEAFDGSEVIGVYDALEARAPHDTSQGITTRALGLHCTGICSFLGLCKGSFAQMTTE